jgi:PIN domain nuclease of toxin-antitoxin system
VRLLIDSNAFIWIVSQPEELSTAADHALRDAANDRYVSMAAIWEISIKLSTGKLSLPGTLRDAVGYVAATPLPIALPHILRTQTLPFHHRDPFDRMMIAQAMEEGLTIVTRDRIFASYNVSVLTA